MASKENLKMKEGLVKRTESTTENSVYRYFNKSILPQKLKPMGSIVKMQSFKPMQKIIQAEYIGIDQKGKSDLEEA